MLDDAFRALFETNLGIRPGERLLVFSDRIRADETPTTADRERRERLAAVAAAAAAFADAIYGNAGYCSFPATAASGAEPPEALWRAAFGDHLVNALVADGTLAALLAKQATPAQSDRARELVLAHQQQAAQVIVALANNSTSHTQFRALANLAGSRYASLPHFDPEMFFTSMRVDWQRLAERTARLAAAVNQGVTLELRAPNGTRLEIGMAGRRAEGDDGRLTAAGSFGNLPAGEVYLAPREGTSNGVLVVEYAPTRKLAAPLTLTVQEGNVVAVSGDDPYRDYLEERFAASSLNRNIAELGIGTNDRATRPDNVLEAEKILGTVHVALGDNAGFGGTVRTPFHEDFVIYQPTLTAVRADGSRLPLLQQGRLLTDAGEPA